MEKEVKVFQAEIKESNEKDLTVTHFISTEKKDRGGDIMRADGMRVRGRPVVLLSHGYSNMGQEPIAKPLSIKKGEFKGNKGIMATTQFYPDELGKRLWDKTTQGYMPSWSIGFIINKKMDLQDEAGNYGRDIKEWELLEYSLVGVPMNPDAQTPGKSQDELQFKFAESSEPLRPEYEIETKSLSIVPDGTDDMIEVSYDEAKGLVDVDAKPYPNEHACRINDPTKYDKVRRQNDKFGDGVHAIWGIKDDETELQAIRFAKDKFTVDEAKTWAKDHDYKCQPFEAASEKSLCDLSTDEKLVLIIGGWKELGDKFDNLNGQIVEGLKASTELMKVLNELPEALKQNQSRSNENPPDETKEFVSVICEEKKDESVILPMTADEIKQCIRETVSSTVKAGLNRITGHID